MMNRFIFIGLAALGAVILFRVIPLLVAIVGEKPICRMPVSDRKASFRLETAGSYAIWLKTRTMFKTYVNIPEPAIFSDSTAGKISLSRTGAMITANDGSGTRRQLYTFSAMAAGNYHIEMAPDAAVDPSFVLEIRKPMPVFRLIVSILGIIAGAAMLIGGIVGVALASQVS